MTTATQTNLQSLRNPAQPETMPVSVGLTNSQSFELAQRAAKMLAASTLVPKDYQGNIPNCVIALNMAQRVGADPLMVMQNLVVVHGRPTWSSQFLIATVNTCGKFSALRYEFFGQPGTDSWGCRAWAIEKATGEKLVGTDVSILMAKREGWYSKNGSKWQSIPQQMLMYRAGAWWTRAYAPELSMGLHTADEVADVYDASRGTDGSYTVDLAALRTIEADMAAAVSEPAIQQQEQPAPKPAPQPQQTAAHQQQSRPAADSNAAAEFFGEDDFAAQAAAAEQQAPAPTGRRTRIVE